MTAVGLPEASARSADRSRPALKGRRLFWTWTMVVAAGESIGFLVPVAIAVVATALPAGVAVPVVLAAGAVEGAVLGTAQQAVLRRALPALRPAWWVSLTAGAAVTAYGCGFVLGYLSGVRSWAAFTLMGCIGAVLLCSIGLAQTVELRHHVAGARRWVLWTAIAWLAALGAFLAIATPLWHTGQSTVAAIAVGAGAGIVMAIVQAAATGWGLLRILAGARQA